jgi:hypothetical protein
MVHSGYEASAVNDTFGSLAGLWNTVRAMAFNQYPDKGAMDLLNKGEKPVHGHNPLVQINASNSEMEETRA